MNDTPVEVTFVEDWRREVWDDSVPSRPAWLVSCREHPLLGRSRDRQPWGYSSSGRAHGVATRHIRAYHAAAAGPGTTGGDDA